MTISIETLKEMFQGIADHIYPGKIVTNVIDVPNRKRIILLAALRRNDSNVIPNIIEDEHTTIPCYGVDFAYDILYDSHPESLCIIFRKNITSMIESLEDRRSYNNTYRVSSRANEHFKKIQDAIDFAKDGDTIIVHPGLYFNDSLDVKGKNITIRSLSPEDVHMFPEPFVEDIGDKKVDVRDARDIEWKALRFLNIDTDFFDDNTGCYKVHLASAKK
jgi:hypothetical protein